MSISTIFDIVLYALLAWFLFTRLRPIKGLKTLNANHFAEQLKGNPRKLLLDVREPHEFKTGFIPGARNLPLSQLQGRLHEISKEEQVLLYCRSGMRSKQAAKILSKNGFANLAHLRGGISAWDGSISKK
jgi:rhodanese-related sulfurtransferase